MPSYYMENFGCRATQADASAIERQFLDRGFRSAGPDEADLFIVNTCTVTASADSRARQAIRSFRRRNPRGQIVVTGCYAQRAPEELAEIEGVRWVVGNAHQSQIANLVMDRQGLSPGEGFVPLARLQAAPSDQVLSPEYAPAEIITGKLLRGSEVLLGPAQAGCAGHTRPTLKIQDGCDHRCAYCVIPLVRGASRSLAPERVIEAIERLARAGAREVVLSGIDLGSYGRDLRPPTSLGDLVGRLIDETAVDRLRLSSLEPAHLTKELVERIARSGRIAPHFHIPLQSGSDRILAAMHRWYRAAHYAERIALIREWLPDAGIGADVIAGFPGETEEEHQATMRMIERLPFTYLHVFSFSPRPGTEAARMGNLVDGETIRRRARELRALSAEKTAAFRGPQAGRTVRALTLETVRNGMRDALTGNYLTVGVDPRWPVNQWLDLRLRKTESGQLAGEPVAHS
jgi:threonylcarbamoyladenosine tRNA methylthiotransferase MtaB